MNAESSTIKHVRGDFTTDVSFSTSSIALLQGGEPPHVKRQIRSHFGERHYLIRISFFHCDSGHSINSAAFLVLRDGVSAGGLDLSQSLRSITAHSGNEDSRCLCPILL